MKQHVLAFAMGLLVSSMGLQAQIDSDEPIPADVLELERSFQVDVLGKAARSNEPGGDLPPSEQLSRVPLRPPMSAANWRRFAGPQYEKLYRVKRGDSLWVISERLFGNPHLWPKVWQLNASVGNAHVLAAGAELLFTPGNPNSAPILAFKSIMGVSDAYLPPMTGHLRERTLLSKIQQGLSSKSAALRFRSFLVRNKPEEMGEIPTSHELQDYTMYAEGSRFRITDVPAGNYAIVRYRDSKANDASEQMIQWLGNIRVRDEADPSAKNAMITMAFEEVHPGDLIVVRNFALAPLALHTEVLGDDGRRGIKLLPAHPGYADMSGEDLVIGAKFPNDVAGPRLGAIVNIRRRESEVAKAVLIDRDEDLGTFWVVDSQMEIALDKDFIQ